MGVSKGEGEPGKGLNLTPRQWLFAKEVLVASGDLRVSRNFPGKSSSSSPSPTLFHLFLPLALPLEFLHPLKPFLPFSRSGLFALSTLPPQFSPPKPFLHPFIHFLGPYQAPSEHLRNPSLRPPKSHKRPKIVLFRPF